PPRNSPPSWSAAARHSTPAPTTRARASRWKFPAHACRRRWGCSPRRCTRPRSPAAGSSGWCATVSMRSRWRWPTPAGARPSSWRRSCSRPPRGCPGRVRAFYQAHVRPAVATAVVVGDLTGIDLDAALAGTLGGWTGDAAGPVHVPPVTAGDTGRVVIVDRPGAVQTQLLIGRTGPDRHDQVWPALLLGTYCLGGTLTSRLDRVLREEKGYTYGVQAFPQVLRSPAPDGAPAAPGASILVISGSVDTASTGPALADTWSVLRTLAASGLTDPERDQAVQNLVGVAPLRYE